MGSVLVGDCREVLPTLGAESVDAVVTDPPYGMGFMGKDWDQPGVAFDPETWGAVLRVLKPGGALLAFGGTRTWHRLACAIEDGGFEIKDTLMWLHGQGFPKGKVLLKPAWEPVLFARKRGKAMLNVEACRIDRGTGDAPGWSRGATQASENRAMSGRNHARPPTSCDKGRWPANVVLDEEAAALLDAAAGERGGGFGSPSRFYYCAKAIRSEREAGLAGMPTHFASVGAHEAAGRDPANPNNYYSDGTRRRVEQGLPATEARANHHPTVKPVALMRWLVRLVTPPGGLVLDPFAGSGSTGVACVLEGLRFAGIEQDAEYAEIARRRIAHAAGPLLAEVANGG